MPTSIQSSVDKYIAVWSERDEAKRKQLIDDFFAEDGRVVMPSRSLTGRAELAAEVTQFLADKSVRRLRVTSPIDCRQTTFRFHTLLEREDGSKNPGFDAGEVDAEGKIRLILTFGGLLVEAYPTNTAVE
jgi:hypothetical protein